MERVSYSFSKALWLAFLTVCWGCFQSVAAEPTQKRKVLKFPPNESIGRLYSVRADKNYLEEDNIFGEFIGPAQGTVTLAANDVVVLDIDSRVVEGKYALPDVDYQGIEAMRLRFIEKTNNVIRFLEKQSCLKRLELHDCELGDNAVARLEALHNLENLMVRNCGLNGDCYSKLKNLKKLHHLNTSSNTLKQSSWHYIAQMKAMTCLDAARTGVTNAALKELSTLPHLQKLNLGSSGGIDADGLKELRATHTLRELFLANTSITVKDLYSSLQGLHLKVVSISRRATKKDLLVYGKTFPGCELQIFRSKVSKDEQEVWAPTH